MAGPVKKSSPKSFRRWQNLSLAQKSVPYMCPDSQPAQNEKAQPPLCNRRLRFIESGSGGRARTYPSTFTESNTSATQPVHIHAKPAQQNSLEASADKQAQQNPDTSEQNQHTLLHSRRVPEEYGFPEDLAEIVEAWPDLSDKLKARLLKIVKESR